MIKRRILKAYCFCIGKKRNLLLVFVSFFAVLLAFTYFLAANDEEIWKELRTKIRANQSTVFFSEVTGFSWDRVCILAPYSLVGGKRALAEKLIDGSLGAYANHLPNVDDDASWAFVFIKNDEVVTIIESPNDLRFRKHYLNNCIEKKAARLLESENTLYISDIGDFDE